MKNFIFILATLLISVGVNAQTPTPEINFQTSPELVIGEAHGEGSNAHYPHYSGDDGDQRGRYAVFNVSNFTQDTWVYFRASNDKLRTRLKWFGMRTMPDSLLIPAGSTQVRVFFTVRDDNIVQAPIETIGMFFDSGNYNYGNAYPKIKVKNEDWLWIRSKPGQSNDAIYEWSQNRVVEFDVNVPYKLYDMTNGKSLLKSGTLTVPANGTPQSISLQGISASKNKLAFEFDRPANPSVDNIHYIVKIQKNHFNLPGRVVQVLPEGYHSSQPVQNSGNAEEEDSQPVNTVVVEEEAPQPVAEEEPEPAPTPTYVVPQRMIDKVRYYYKINVEAGRTGKNWWRVLIAFGVETHDTWTAMTAAEVEPKIKRWSGWKPIYDTLLLVEGSTSTKSSVVAYPNPFNPSTTLSYETNGGYVSVAIYNLLGQRIRSLVSENTSPGLHRVVWNAENDMGHRVATGRYIARIQTPQNVSMVKLLLLK